MKSLKAITALAILTLSSSCETYVVEHGTKVSSESMNLIENFKTSQTDISLHG